MPINVEHSTNNCRLQTACETWGVAPSRHTSRRAWHARSWRPITMGRSAQREHAVAEASFGRYLKPVRPRFVQIKTHRRRVEHKCSMPSATESRVKRGPAIPQNRPPPPPVPPNTGNSPPAPSVHPGRGFVYDPGSPRCLRIPIEVRFLSQKCGTRRSTRSARVPLQSAPSTTVPPVRGFQDHRIHTTNKTPHTTTELHVQVKPAPASQGWCVDWVFSDLRGKS